MASVSATDVDEVNVEEGVAAATVPNEIVGEADGASEGERNGVTGDEAGTECMLQLLLLQFYRPQLKANIYCASGVNLLV